MSRTRTFATIVALGLAAGTSAGGAYLGVLWVESHSVDTVGQALDRGGQDWATPVADGLQLILTGTAPNEPARLRAVTLAARVVDPARIVDGMDVEAAAPQPPPRYGLEILRNDAGISVIGLVPERGVGRDALEEGLTGYAEVTNMVETADRAVPPGWARSVEYAMNALRDLEQAKISVGAGHVAITAVADSDEERRRLEAGLRRGVPDGLRVDVEIAAPRPVIAPFTTRFVLDEAGARFDACAAGSARGVGRILLAARAAGAPESTECTVALGAPSASWPDAVARAIEAVAALGGGAVTLSDADVTLVAPEGTASDAFDALAAELDADLPGIFTLTALNPAPLQDEDAEDGTIPVFTAMREPNGSVRMGGRLRDRTQEAAVASYGRALFGVDGTRLAPRFDDTLPQGWPARVLAGLAALGELNDGSLLVREDLVSLRGRTGSQTAEAEIARLLSDRLGADGDFRIDVIYAEELDPTLNIPTPEECVARLSEAQAGDKLSFAPGAAVLTTESADVLADLVTVLRDCRREVFEVGGHTDSQGREVMNQELSQERAEAVRAALIERGLSPSQLTARGYGESEPIADNGTEAGREANRRIVFTLAGQPVPRDPDGPAPDDDDAGAGADAADSTAADAVAAQDEEGTEAQE
ncbi:OmpA family protein [Jannaschia sp. LMIT008]|uniref:OmpA family protein n=1 Tax=Jannaschia maritima TaxID=3032585 RepID=UPI002810AC23|nr:OmpA family protein [Jannaschia sp. LMIT008]